MVCETSLRSGGPLYGGQWTPIQGAALSSVGSAGELIERVFRGEGCGRCWNTGYRGRSGVYELLTMNDALRTAVAHHQAAGELRSLAAGHGMRTLEEDEWRVVRAGITTPEEVLRACGR
jgi:type II secretory ATPase GspE/PulE/Tfp pilus assembly ATPase PilB-like protein